jgi:hypothetical protein
MLYAACRVTYRGDAVSSFRETRLSVLYFTWSRILLRRQQSLRWSTKNGTRSFINVFAKARFCPLSLDV